MEDLRDVPLSLALFEGVGRGLVDRGSGGGGGGGGGEEEETDRDSSWGWETKGAPDSIELIFVSRASKR